MNGGLLQFIGSLAAVCVLVAIAWRLRLGAGGARLASEAEARGLADNAVCGFVALDVALDAEGNGALLRDTEGRILLLRPHGIHFAARLLDKASMARCDGTILTIRTGETAFPETALDLGEAAKAWERRIGALNS